jgi:uncharacterized membrane protein YesL
MIQQRLRDQLVDAYLVAIPITTLNMLWFVASLPIVTLIPATGALLYATNQLAHGKPADWRVFVEGFRRYFWRSWSWGILNILVAVILASNYIFYGQIDESLRTWARAVVVTLAFLWLTVQLYTFPLLIEQEKPHLRTALRNSFVILLKRPFYAFGSALIVAALAIGSTLIIQPAWIFVTASVCAYLANRTTLRSISRITGQVETPESKPGNGALSPD